MSLTEKLDPTERVEWSKQLSIVDKGKEFLWQTVEALAVIKKDRLFREEYRSFAEFVRARLDVTERYASMLITASSTRSDLGTFVPETLASKINNPWKLRNLSGLTSDQLKEVVKHAESVANGKEITAKLIAASKKIVLGEPDAESDNGGQEDQETVELSKEMQAFQDALDGIDAVDGLLHVLSTLGSVDDQALILAEIAPELVAAIRA